MAEFIGEEKLVSKGEIVFENKTDSSFDVGMGVVFHKSGIYEVSIVGNKTIVSEAGKSKTWPESAREYCAECDHIEMCRWYPYEGCEFRSLPSAQLEPVCINLNEPIKVKLTDWGKEIYYHRYDRINQIVGREVCKPSFPKEDENGYTEFQLWCFIELYGMHMGMALPNVIEPLEIIYGEENG